MYGETNVTKYKSSPPSQSPSRKKTTLAITHPRILNEIGKLEWEIDFFRTNKLKQRNFLYHSTIFMEFGRLYNKFLHFGLTFGRYSSFFSNSVDSIEAIDVELLLIIFVPFDLDYDFSIFAFELLY